MNFGMTDDSFLVKITNRPDFNNHIENQSIKKLKKFAKRPTMILLKFFYYFKLRIKRKNKIIVSAWGGNIWRRTGCYV